MIDNITATAAEEGLDFRFDPARPGNTFDAHRRGDPVAGSVQANLGAW